jgi:hypothetical protein
MRTGDFFQSAVYDGGENLLHAIFFVACFDPDVCINLQFALNVQKHNFKKRDV